MNLLVSVLIIFINIFVYGPIVYTSFLYINKNKERHAYMIVIGSLLILLTATFQQLYQNILRPNIEGYSSMELEIPSLIISILGCVGFIIFSIGFFFLVKKSSAR